MITPVPYEKPYLAIIDALLHPRATNLPERVQVVYMHNALKVLVAAVKTCEDDELLSIIELFTRRMHVFMQSTHIEVQERASDLKHMLSLTGILVPPADDPDTPDQQGDDGDKPVGGVTLLSLPITLMRSLTLNLALILTLTLGECPPTPFRDGHHSKPPG